MAEEHELLDEGDVDLSALEWTGLALPCQRLIGRDLSLRQAPDDAISCKLRKKVEMLFAQLKRIPGLDRLRLRGPSGARDELHLAATAQNLRKPAKLIPIPQVAC